MITNMLEWLAYGLLAALLSTGCAGQKPVLVGFAGELTGMQGQLGVDARDGAQLAVDLINEKGGIEGRLIQLIIRNDEGDPDTARQVDADLVKQNVVAIIGHITSEQTAAVLDQINRDKVVLLSPASSGSQFSGRADYFYRIVPDTQVIGRALAIHIFSTRGVRQLVGVYDLSNRTFSEPLWGAIEEKFVQLGGEAGQTVTFRSGETDLKAVMAQVKAMEPQAVLLVASPIDTALMVQYGRQQGLDALLFSSSWAQSADLLEKGGRAVEGLELAAGYILKNPYPAFDPFAEQFEARYNRQPGMLAGNGFEAVLVLAQALKQTGGEATGLGDALTSVRNLEGVRGNISLDDYGDVRRDIYIVRVKKGQFELVDTIMPGE